MMKCFPSFYLSSVFQCYNSLAFNFTIRSAAADKIQILICFHGVFWLVYFGSFFYFFSFFLHLVSSSSDTLSHKDKFFNQDKDPLLCLFMPPSMKRAQNFKGDRHLEDWKAWANNASFSSVNGQWSVALIHGQEQVTALKLQMGILEFVVRWGNGETVEHSLPTANVWACLVVIGLQKVFVIHLISLTVFIIWCFINKEVNAKCWMSFFFSSDILTCCQRKV